MAAEDRLATLVLQIEARTAEFQKQTEKATRVSKRMDKQFRRSASSANLLSKAFRRLVPVFSAAAVVNATRRYAAFGAEIQNTSERVGFAVESLQELRAAGQEVGVSFQTTDMALQRFSRRWGEAAAGAGELLKTLEELGIETRDADGNIRSAEDGLADFADAIAQAESDSDALRLAFKAFDSEGAALVGILKDGSEGLDEFRSRAAETGQVLRSDLVSALNDLNTQWDAWITRISTQGASAFANLAVNIFGSEEQKALTRARNQLDAYRQQLSDFQQEIRTYEAPTGLARFLSLQPDDVGRRWSRIADELTTNIQRMEAEVERLTPKIEKVVTPPAAAAPGAAFEGAVSSISGVYVPAIEDAEVAMNDLAGATDTVVSGFSDELARALVTGEANFKRFAQSVLADIAQMIIRATVFRAITSGLSGLGGTQLGNLGHIFAAKGLAYQGSDIKPLARGGVINSPTLLAGGAAIGGEAGPEGVLPLKRTRSGDLGVQVAGGAGFAPSVTVNLNGPVDDGVATGQQIGAEVNRQIKLMWASSARNEMRPGGVLNPVA